MKRVILIHGWEGSPEDGWKPWLKSELEKEGFFVIVPAMPDPAHPKMKAWLSHLKKSVGTPDKDCYLVGHSLGCITILRYLESINRPIGGAVLVAGFTSSLGYKDLESFFKTPIMWEKIRQNCGRVITINSDNDPYVSIHYANFFKKELNAESIIEHDMKHFSGDDGITKLPVAKEAMMKMARG
jgi:predicted alpha/beta hydrolase family esterase